MGLGKFGKNKSKTADVAGSTRHATSMFKKSSVNNLSQGLERTPFAVSQLQQYGEAGRVKALGFDPVQSLLALATEYGQICIFGQARVCFTLQLQSTSSITALKFVKGIYLLAFDTSSTIYVISLLNNKLLRTIRCSIGITAFDTDYSLEWIYVGLKNGGVKAYNIETGRDTYLNIRDEQRQFFPNSPEHNVTSVRLHPRDLATLLISYPYVTITYNLIENKVTNSFVYNLEKTAQGGENASYRYDSNGDYIPQTLHSRWHPNGLHIVTVHDDNSIVFWDVKTGERILARTLFDSFVDAPTGHACQVQPQKMTSIKQIEWLCGSNSEKTALLILGGDAYTNEGFHQLVRMDFGKMISYSMSSYDQMAKYYSQPKQQNIFVVHAKASIDSFLPLPSKSPYFYGARDPSLIAVILKDGMLKFLNYPEGSPTYEAHHFPATLSWLNPKITCSSSSYLDKRILNSIYDALPSNESILKGGIPSRPTYRAEAGSVVITGHESGFIRVWNSSDGDLNSNTVLEIDISEILQDDSYGCSVSQVSFAPEQLELTCSLYNGYVLLFSYQSNKFFQPNAAGLAAQFKSLSLNDKRALIDITNRAPLHKKKGFMPKLLVKPLNNGKVTAISNSNVGFVAIGYENGMLIVIDRRGSVVIYNELLQDTGLSIKAAPTSIAFGFGITQDGESKSNVLMYVGTSIGRLITYKLVPDSVGRYSVKKVEQIDSNDSTITDILAVNSVDGRPCSPSMQQLKSTELDFPLVVASSFSDIRVIQKNSKVAHKTYSKGDVAKVGITGGKTPNGNVAFCVQVVLGKTKKLLSLSLPSLSELSNLRLPYRIDDKYATQSSVLPLGDVFVRISETEAALINTMGLRQAVKGPHTNEKAEDILFLKNIIIPARPVFNVVLKNTPNVTYAQLYELMEGKHRPSTGSEEYTAGWKVSPHNPANYSLLGDTKPKYYEPNSLHMNADVNKSPKSRVTSGEGWSVAKLKKYAATSWESNTDKATDYLSDVNDTFDQFVKQTKEDALKSIIKDKF